MELLELIIIVGAIIAGVVYLFSRTRQTETEEIRKLANTRGEVINDLRLEVEALRREVAELRGALAAVQSLKTDEMARAAADATFERLAPFLGIQATGFHVPDRGIEN